MRKFEATDVQKIYLGSDASCSKSLSGIISTLRLNEDEVHRNEVRSKKKVPLFLRAVEFRGEASLQFEKLGFDLRDQFQLEIRLKTNATCGLLFFLTSTTAGSDYAMLSLVDSHPVFTFDLGSGPASLKVPKITEDEWTYIKIERQQRNTSVSIDGRPVGAQISSASNVHFDVADPILYLGHVPDETVLPEEQRLNNKPFTGFLRYFSVNEFPLDMHHVSFEQLFGKLHSTRRS
ncbi:unnamed protein product [Caenorhabditis auriculariae]|uniref:Laminin G domain-containing protein n=1 Tax=Caenorhabditis auriculariae TaxID=2777116 RepID=A0A8S1HYE6_9PELO|nr:unnamed protein product [Caenorhabditis auriculariae]